VMDPPAMQQAHASPMDEAPTLPPPPNPPGAQIADRVLASRAFAAARTVGVYIHCARLSEVDTMPVLAAALARGKRCYVPLVDDQDSNMRLLHIGEPARGGWGCCCLLAA
jgi:5-formyltetrahydrofolate cyclo-ligase